MYPHSLPVLSGSANGSLHDALIRESKSNR